MKYKLSAYNHEFPCSLVGSIIVDADSLSSAAKLSEKHFEELLKENKDVTLKVEELKE
jgi:hypothetical protein